MVLYFMDEKDLWGGYKEKKHSWDLTIALIAIILITSLVAYRAVDMRGMNFERKVEALSELTLVEEEPAEEIKVVEANNVADTLMGSVAEMITGIIARIISKIVSFIGMLLQNIL